MTDREERRAAAIERAKFVRYEHQVNTASYAHLPDRVIAAVLDASGLLDYEYEQVGWINSFGSIMAPTEGVGYREWVEAHPGEWQPVLRRVLRKDRE